jgi:uncharacterized protein YodC (DUF2158 family)
MCIGNTVYLKSGSPKMKIVGKTVSQLSVEWLADDGELQNWTLPEVCFRSAKDV